MDLFAQYGALDSVTSYSSRNYAFVFFKQIEVAKVTKDTLQGINLHGHPIKSESDSEAGTGLSGAEGRRRSQVRKSGARSQGRARPRTCSFSCWVFKIVFFWLQGFYSSYSNIKLSN
nr:isoform 2 of flowering time control protein fpa [Quercus suber]